MRVQLDGRERWILEQLADDDQRFVDLAWLGRHERRTEEAIETLLSLLGRGYVEVRECYAADSWSRVLTSEEASGTIADVKNWRPSMRSTPWHEASATESLWGPSERPYRDRYLP
jgi:hypothetical protein